MAASFEERIRGAVAALNNRDAQKALDWAADDLVMDWSNSIGPLKGIYRGRNAVIEVFRTFLDAFEFVSWDPEEIIEIDSRTVLVMNRVRMRGQGSGVDVDALGAQVWRLDESGEARSVTLYQSKAEAMEALGAEPA